MSKIVRDECGGDEKMWFEPPNHRTGKSLGTSRVGGGITNSVLLSENCKASVSSEESQVSLSLGSNNFPE